MDSLNISSRIFNFCAARSSRTANSGWTIFNGSCCVHRGAKRPDTKKRAGVRYSDAGGVIYSCFNCGAKAVWQPGSRLSSRWKQILEWMSIPVDELKRIEFDAWRFRSEEVVVQEEQAKSVALSFTPKELPVKARPFSFWIEEGCEDPNFLDCATYVLNRSPSIYDGYEYFWTPEKSKAMNRRVIIPFYWKEELVGWTGRTVDRFGERYHKEIASDYIFNTDRIKRNDKYIIITEGPFDAIASNGVATLGDNITQKQKLWLAAQPQKKIVVPDREKMGGKLVDTALEMGWSVSLPLWPEDVKDAADANRKHGKLYTIKSILENTTDNSLKIRTWRQIILNKR